MLLTAITLVAHLAVSPTPSSTPSPTPSPTTSPTVVITTVVSGYALAPRSDVSNALVSAVKANGPLLFGTTAGAYAFPVVGQPATATWARGANVALYGYLPVVYAGYAPNTHLSILAGQLATSIGAENPFTYQNVNIERDLSWNIEPVVSRGARVVYTSGPITANIEFNDGFYSSSHRAVEGALIWAPTSTTSMEASAIIPSKDTPGNATASIANKAEYSLVMTRTLGKFTATPWVLLVQSPASNSVGYASAESAWGGGFFASYALTPSFSIGGRYGYLHNQSSSADASANADLIGYGAGSSATSLTITPQFRAKQLFIRGEYGLVSASQNQGAGRFAFEAGLQF